jgi:hypothetical protein
MLLTAAPGGLEISQLDPTMVEPRVERLAMSTSGDAALMLNRTPKPRRSIRRGTILANPWDIARDRPGGTLPHGERSVRDRSSLKAEICPFGNLTSSPQDPQKAGGDDADETQITRRTHRASQIP